MATKRPVRAAGVLVMTQTPVRQFLLMRHPDRWDLPKGHCDGNETYREAAQRELHEETGIDPRQCLFDEHFQFDLTYEVTYPARANKAAHQPENHQGAEVLRKPEVFQKTVRYFLACVPTTVKIKVTEHESYRWFAWSPPHRIQSQTIDPLLAKVAEYLHGDMDV